MFSTFFLDFCGTNDPTGADVPLNIKETKNDTTLDPVLNAITNYNLLNFYHFLKKFIINKYLFIRDN